MQVKINSHGVDQVSLDFLVSGTNEAFVMCQETPLDNSLDYVLCVNDLTIPTNGLPIFLPDLPNTELFNIKKRITGAAVGDVALDTQYPNSFHTKGRFGSEQHFYNTASFLTDLAAWANTFSDRRIEGGMPAVDYVAPTINAAADITLLNIGIDGSGRLRFKGSSHFWNRFMIEVSDYAAALFHLTDVVHDGHISVSLIGGVTVLDGLLNGGVIRVGGVVSTTTVAGTLSCFNNLDHRHEILLDTHLSIPNQIEIRDNVEQSDRYVVRVPFLNRSKVTVHSSKGVIDGDFDLATETYLGRYPFVRKTDKFKNWVTLNTNYELRYFKFILLCSYRYFDGGKFSLKKIGVPIDKHDFWEMNIRFVSIV